MHRLDVFEGSVFPYYFRFRAFHGVVLFALRDRDNLIAGQRRRE